MNDPFVRLRRRCKSLLALCVWLAAPSAMADLMLFPTRVVFDKTDRSAQVELVNQGSAPETYRIRLVNRRMSEDGVFQEVDQPLLNERFADELLRFSPKQVTIEPGGSQTVRIMLRKPAALDAGEYRSHLQFDRVADSAGTGGLDTADARGAASVGVTITTLVGASIPVIVRHGETQAEVELSALRLHGAGSPESWLTFELRRIGTRSVYGDFAATFTPSKGQPVSLSLMRGVAVYVPNALRRIRMPLNLPDGTPLKAGSVTVEYRERAEAGGKLLSTTSLTLP